MRAVAAFCVVVMHTGAIYFGSRVIGPAYLAVDFFFMLSGFVMARTYEARMRSGAMPTLAFLKGRYLRLWPTMLAGALLSLPFAWRDSANLSAFLQNTSLNIVLLPAIGAATLFALNMPAWSIFVELVANALHVRLWSRWSTRSLAWFAAAAAAALAVCGWYFGDLDVGARTGNMIGGLVRVSFAYSLGVLLWRWHSDTPPLAVPPLSGLILMPLAFVLVTAAGLEGWQFDLLFVTGICPLLVWSGLGVQRFQRLASAAGALSFPLYAVHFPVILAGEATGIPAPLVILTALLIAVLIARTIPALQNHIFPRTRTA